MEIKSHAGVPLNSRLALELIRQQLDAGQTIFLSDDERLDLAGDSKHFYSVPQAYS